MNDFSSFGYLSLLFSVVVGAFTYIEVKWKYNIPWFLNLPGAVFSTVTAFLLAGWGFTVSGVFALTMPADFPGINPLSVINMLISTVCWYWLSISISKMVRRKGV
jgi:hypothetical protein